MAGKGRNLWKNDVNKKLTPRQKAFCEAYSEFPHSGEAAKTAGYSQKSAPSIGCRLFALAQCQKYIKSLQSEILLKSRVSADQVRREIESIAMSDANKATLKEKQRALNLLSKILGMQVDNVRVEHHLTDDEIAKRLNAALGPTKKE